MDHLSQFISNHLLLSFGFIAVIIAIFVLEARSSGLAGGHRITPQMLTHLINRDKGVVVDIRDVQSKQLQKHKNKQLIVVDAMGQKAATYRTKLLKSGFEDVSLLGGGINAWKVAKMPLVKGNK